jgi:hypothetical protein
VKSNMLIVITLLAVAGIAVPARALQATSVVTVPFDFFVGATKLPAGTYTLRTTGDADSPLLLSNREHAVFILPSAFDGTAAEDARFGFDTVGGEHVLSQIKTLDGIYTIDDSREAEMLTKLAQPKDHAPATGMTSSGGN